MPRSAPESVLRYPLTQVLGSESLVRLLRTLVRHGGQLAAPALAEQSGLARSSVHQAIATLESLGLIESAGSGRARLYSLNQAHPLVPPIVALFEAEARRWEEIRKSVGAAAKSSDAVIAAWMYGSAARGQDHAGSDLDIGIVSVAGEQEAGLESISEALRPAEAKLAFAASIVAIDTADVVRLAGDRDPWWESLRRDAIAVHGDPPERLLAKLLREASDVRAA